MKLKDRIAVAFAAYGLLYGVVLGVAVTFAFFTVEDLILDRFLRQAQEQISASIMRNTEPVSPRGFTLYTNANDAPEAARSMPPGRYEIAQYRHVAVFEHPVDGDRLYLMLDETEAGLDVLLSRILFATLLALVCAVLVGILIARWLSGQLMQPMKTLMERIDSLDVNNPALEPLPRDDEIGFLSRRFSETIERLNAHDRRERDFTRFASHELRSPITVVRGTNSILRSDEGLSARSRRALDRAEGAVRRMSRLVEAFLFLGRSSTHVHLVSVSAESVAAEIRQLADGYSDEESMTLDCRHRDGSFTANQMLLSIVLENLIANAAKHGDGEIIARVEPPVISLSNRIADSIEPGHGFGIEISRRICERLGFDLRVERSCDRWIAQVHQLS